MTRMIPFMWDIQDIQIHGEGTKSGGGQGWGKEKLESTCYCAWVLLWWGREQDFLQLQHGDRCIFLYMCQDPLNFTLKMSELYKSV